MQKYGGIINTIKIFGVDFVKRLISLLLCFTLLSITAYADTEQMNPIILASYVGLIEDALGCDLFSAASDDADVQALIDRIQHEVTNLYTSLGFEPNSVSKFFDDRFRLPIVTSPYPLLKSKVCAQYWLCNEYVACRTGSVTEDAFLYSYAAVSDESSKTDAELWQYFEELKQYLAENRASVVLDGAAAGADMMWVVIDILTSTEYYRAVYDLITDECTLQTM